MGLSNKIKIHPLTLFVLSAGLLTGYFKYLLFIFSIVLVHELGHIFMMKVFRRHVTSIEILPFGGITKVDAKISENIFEDLLITVGGIFFQTILGAVLFAMYHEGKIDYRTFEFLNTYNILIILFNLLPICPLDGFKILKLFGELFFSFKRVYKCSIFVSILVILIAFLYKVDVVKDNIFVFTFLVFMCIEEMRNEPHIMNRFYVERMNYDFDYTRKNIKKLEAMHKNRNNYIDGVFEKEKLKNHFSRISN